MADIKISDMPSATTVSGTDVVPVVQSATNKKSALSVIKTYLQSAFDAIYVPLTRALTINGITHDLSADRSWTITDSFTPGNLTDAGTDGIVVTGGTGAVNGSGTSLAQHVADTTHNGYLSSTDWNTFNGKAGESFKTIAVSGQSDVVADAAADTLTLAAGSNITLTTNAGTDTVTIAAAGGSGGASTADHFITTQSETDLSNEFSLGSLTTGLLKHSVSAGVSTPATAVAGTDYTDNAFKTISVSGQTDVVADSAADTLTLVAGTGVTIVTDVSTDSVTLAVSGFAVIGQDPTIPAYQALGSAMKGQTVGCNMANITGAYTLTNQQALFVAVYFPSGGTITGVKWIQIGQGSYTNNNNNKVGLYTYSGGTLTRVAQSADDGTLWKVAGGGFGSKAFSGTYSASAGIYFVGLIYCRSAESGAPSIAKTDPAAGATSAVSADFTNSAKLWGFISSQTDLPSAQAMSGLSTSSFANVWVALY